MSELLSKAVVEAMRKREKALSQEINGKCSDEQLIAFVEGLSDAQMHAFMHYTVAFALAGEVKATMAIEDAMMGKLMEMSTMSMPQIPAGKGN